jgi:hypothetical protein
MLDDKGTVEIETILVTKEIDEETREAFKKLISSHRDYQREVKRKEKEIKVLTEEVFRGKLLKQALVNLLED